MTICSEAKQGKSACARAKNYKINFSKSFVTTTFFQSGVKMWTLEGMIQADFGLSFEKQRPDLGKDFDVRDALIRFFREVTLHGYASPCVAYGMACLKMPRQDGVMRVATTHLDVGERLRTQGLLKGIALFEHEESVREKAAAEAAAYLEKMHDKQDFAWLFEVCAMEKDDVSIEFLLIKKTL